MSSEHIIRVENLSKCYEVYAAPIDRLKQLILPPLSQAVSRPLKAVGVNGLVAPSSYYREFWALRGVDLAVGRGQSFGIVGRNGSGKSTLLQMICGTLTPTSGLVSVKGRISALLELGSGFNPDYTGRENVYLNGQILGLSHREVDTRFQEIASFADIGPFIDQPIKTYSSGMVVRLAFAVAVNVDPEILVVDEALAVGDLGFQMRCYAKIADLRQKGVTLLFVSHSMTALTQLCQNAIVLDRGEMLFSGAASEAVRAYNYLASAGPTTLEQVRSDIRARYLASSQKEPIHPLSIPLPNRPDAQLKVDDVEEGAATASFDAEYEEIVANLPSERSMPAGAEIIEYRICTSAGTKVNILPSGETFVLKFTVRFDRDIDKVRFAWVVRSVNGQLLGGGASHPPGEGLSVSANSCVEVESHFDNIFLSGDYLIDIGVRGMGDIPDEFIHGIPHALGFRSVHHAESKPRNGVVDCLVEPYFRLNGQLGQSEAAANLLTVEMDNMK